MQGKQGKRVPLLLGGLLLAASAWLITCLMGPVQSTSIYFRYALYAPTLTAGPNRDLERTFAQDLF